MGLGPESLLLFTNLEFKNVLSVLKKAGNELAPYKELYEIALKYKSDTSPSNMGQILSSINDLDTQALIILKQKDKISKKKIGIFSKGSSL